ncbi:MAG: outer membrane protein assembly factor BamD [Parachlamydiales bacterium]|jgi:tetratricopeptide (TPR) repeat protein
MKLLKITLGLFCLSQVFFGAEEKPVKKGLTIQECLQRLESFSGKKDWNRTIKYGSYLTRYRSKTPGGIEALYFLGVAYFEQGELEKANLYFTKYLSKNFMPKYFEEALKYKFQIADKFYGGAKKPLFGSEKMPAWLPAKEDALKIYAEVINGLPQTEMAMKALFNSARIHFDFEEYKEAIEKAENFIGKYPKHELAIESFLLISQAYLKQASPRHQEDDLLNLAQINLEHFQKAFPGEERILEAKKDLLGIKEIYAEGLFEVAQFYLKKGQASAAEIYHKKILSAFAETRVAEKISRMALPQPKEEKAKG